MPSKPIQAYSMRTTPPQNFPDSASRHSTEPSTVNNTTTIHHPPHRPITIATPNNLLRSSHLASLNLRTYDPGYANTALATSSITYTDGNRGILRYRGYPIEQLATSANYLEVAWLLFKGELPASEELERFRRDIFEWGGHVGQGVKKVVDGFERGKAMPMGMMMGGVAAFGSEFRRLNPALNKDWDKENNARWECFVRLLGGLPVIAAEVYWSYKGIPSGRLWGRGDMEALWKRFGRNIGYGERFLKMVGLQSGTRGRKLGRILEVLLVLHADHELNCSTATMRGLASSGVDVWSCVVGSIAALYGPLHGGATEAVVSMLEGIGTVENVASFLKGLKRGEERLMGFGHRVYRSYDPRAKIVGRLAHEAFDIVGKKDPLIDVAVALEKEALSDDYFVERKLYPNVDFYSGLIYKAMGFPKEFFPVLFSMGRIAGWMSHWNEFLDDPDKRIARPTQNYVGYGQRNFLPIGKRTGDTNTVRAKL